VATVCLAGEMTEGCSSSTSGAPPRLSVVGSATQGPAEVRQGGDGARDKTSCPSSRSDHHGDRVHDSPSERSRQADCGAALSRGDPSWEERSHGSTSPVLRSSSWVHQTLRLPTLMLLAKETRSSLSVPLAVVGAASERLRDEEAISPRNDRPTAVCGKQSSF
jgi:hypothetical protein